MTCEADAVFFADCAARSSFDQIASKWSVMSLTMSCQRRARFNELRRRLEGGAHKALAQALRRLERNGLIARSVLTTPPVAAEYTVNLLGRTFQAPLGAVYDWAIANLGEIKAARKAYDRRGAE